MGSSAQPASFRESLVNSSDCDLMFVFTFALAIQLRFHDLLTNLLNLEMTVGFALYLIDNSTISHQRDVAKALSVLRMRAETRWRSYSTSVKEELTINGRQAAGARGTGFPLRDVNALRSMQSPERHDCHVVPENE